MTYFAYLDEFGHIGPYVRRADQSYKESPVFGLAGFVLPAIEVRGFGTWFFQRRCELLDFEIKRSGEHPVVGRRTVANEGPCWHVDGRQLSNASHGWAVDRVFDPDIFRRRRHARRKYPTVGTASDYVIRGTGQVVICPMTDDSTRG